jgi:diguanylate cyclase (GGDEF)-like protein
VKIKLRYLLALVIILMALLPSVTISLILLEKQYQSDKESMLKSLDRGLDNRVLDFDFQFSIFTNNFKLFSRERYLVQALNSFLFSSHAFAALKDFVEQTPLVSSIYLLNTKLDIVEEYQGSIIGLEQSELLQQIRNAIDANQIKDGRQLLFQFQDKTLTGAENDPSVISDYGVAVLMPLYLHVLQEGVNREAEGYILAVLPFDAIHQVFQNRLQKGEALEIVNEQTPIALSAGTELVLQHPDHLMAVKQLEIGSSLSENTLGYSLIMHVRTEERMALIANTQKALSGSIVIAIIIAITIAYLLAHIIGQPFKQLANVLEQYNAGNYKAPTLKFTFTEFEQVRKLIAGMGDTITRQLNSLQDKNRELLYLDKLKDDYLNKLTSLNEQLEQRINKKTQALQTALSREEQSKLFMQSLLKLSIELQQCENNQQITALSIKLLGELFPENNLAFYFPATQYQDEVFACRGIIQSTQQRLQESLLHLSRSRISALPKTIQLNELQYYLFRLGAVNQRLLGALLVQSDGLTDEQRNDLRLFTKQIGAIVENRLLTDELEIMARTDEMTGLANRKAFEESMEEFKSNLERYGDRHYGLFIVDANGLKQANDQFGHQAGDLLLKALSSLLCTVTRKSDKVFRLGGDEFALLIQDGTIKGCEQLMERLIQAQGKHSIKIFSGAGKQESVDISYSFGFASSEEFPPNRLFKVADERMYQQKQGFYQRKETQSKPDS